MNSNLYNINRFTPPPIVYVSEKQDVFWWKGVECKIPYTDELIKHLVRKKYDKIIREAHKNHEMDLYNRYSVVITKRHCKYANTKINLGNLYKRFGVILLEIFLSIFKADYYKNTQKKPD